VDRFVKAFNEDGREFIRHSTERMKEWRNREREVVIPLKGNGHRRKRAKSPATADVVPIPALISHFVMNLPATATEFLGRYLMDLSDLDAFHGIYRESEHLFEPHTDRPLPLIHVYCFQSPETASEVILGEIRKALGHEIDQNELSIHSVRNVSPNKVSSTLATLIEGHVLLYI
jgi:tRNA (guanine37-N1)-methyltransferase